MASGQRSGGPMTSANHDQVIEALGFAHVPPVVMARRYFLEDFYIKREGNFVEKID